MKTNFVKEKIPFTQVPNEVICHKELSGRAKAVYCYLYSRPDGWEYYITEIVKNFKEQKEYIRKALDELEHFGYLIKTRVRKEDGTLGGYDISLKATATGHLIQDLLLPQWTTPTVDKVYTSNTDIITNTKKKRDSCAKEDLEEEKIDFTTFYSLYPRKKSKASAKKKWDKLSIEIQKKCISTLSSKEYILWTEDKIKKKEEEFIKHPSTWLNQECWDDDIDSPKNNNDKTSTNTNDYVLTGTMLKVQALLEEYIGKSSTPNGKELILDAYAYLDSYERHPSFKSSNYEMAGVPTSYEVLKAYFDDKRSMPEAMKYETVLRVPKIQEWLSRNVVRLYSEYDKNIVNYMSEKNAVRPPVKKVNAEVEEDIEFM